MKTQSNKDIKMSKNRATYGVWRVTTEGSVEGRTRHLGVHEGYLEDIAFALATSARYVLSFELMDTKAALLTRNEVFVQLYTPKGQGAFGTQKLMNMLKEAGVKNEKGIYYESVLIYSEQSKEEMARNTALEKLSKAGLTTAERKAIGLE